MGLGPWIDLDAPALGEALPERTDVAVIGGGLAGVSCALFLAEAGVAVTLLEGLPGVGLRASGRRMGFVETGVLEQPHRTVASLGDEAAAALFRFCERGGDLLEERGLLERTGGLWAALDQREPAEIDRSVEVLTRLGFAAERLEAGDVDRRTGGYNFGPALWRPRDGRIEAGPAVRTLAAEAEAAGAVLVGNAEVLGIDDVDEGLAIRLDGDDVLHADAVVIAAGAGSASVEPALSGHLLTIREQSLLTAPIFAWYAQSGRAGHGYTSFRQLPDGHLLVSGCRWATPHLQVGERDDTVLVQRIQDKLEAFFRFHFPAGEETPVIDRWAWVFAQGRDGLPFVGPMPGTPNRIACCGFGANGTAMEVAAARAVADGLLHGTNDAPASMAPVRLVKWRNA